MCVHHSKICDGDPHCSDKSDEMCKASCLKSPLKYNAIVTKCQEDEAVCIPVDQICDRVIDCPQGSDEANCSCEDWEMHQCTVAGVSVFQT